MRAKPQHVQQGGTTNGARVDGKHAKVILDVLLSNRKMKKMHVLISHYFLPIFVEN